MNTQDKEWLIRLGSVAIPLVGWIIYFFNKSKNANIQQIIPIMLIVFSAIGVIIIFRKKLSGLMKVEDNKLPNSLSKQEVEEIIKNTAYDRFYNLDIDKPYEWIKEKPINNDIIHARRVNVHGGEPFIIIINTTHPNIVKPTIYPAYYKDEEGKLKEYDKDNFTVGEWMNEASLNPLDQPDKIKKRVSLDQFNRPVEETEQTIHREKKEEKENMA